MIFVAFNSLLNTPCTILWHSLLLFFLFSDVPAFSKLSRIIEQFQILFFLPFFIASGTTIRYKLLSLFYHTHQKTERTPAT